MSRKCMYCGEAVYDIPPIHTCAESDATITHIIKDLKYAPTLELRTEQLDDTINVLRRAVTENKTLRTKVTDLEAEVERAHEVLDRDGYKIIRNAKDGYPEGREPKVFTLTERVEALGVMKDDYKRWMEKAEAEVKELELHADTFKRDLRIRAEKAEAEVEKHRTTKQECRNYLVGVTPEELSIEHILVILGYTPEGF